MSKSLFLGSLKLKVVYRLLSELTPYANNARRHTRAQLKVLQKSIRAYGFVVPIIIDQDGNILCGHGRFEVAKMMGMDEVPTIMLDHLNEAERRAYILMDNAVADMAGLDKKIARKELQGLIALGYDVELTGFTTLKIDSILNIGEDKKEEQFIELPSAARPVVSRLGDRWTDGKHVIYCGDATDPASYEILLDGLLAQLIFTDPVYNVKVAGNVSGLGKVKHGEFVQGSGELSDAEFEIQLLRPAFRNIARNSSPGAIAFLCMDWRGGRILQNAADGVFHELKNMIVWVKPNAGMGSFYRSQHELVYAYKVSPGEHINNFGLGAGGRHRSNVWIYEGANSFRRGREKDLADHPTIKNTKMVADAILDCSKPNGVVLDVFLGSGTTILAAEQAGRRGFGMDLDPKYVDVAIRRIQAETGRPMLLKGKTFDEVAAERLGETAHD